MKKFFLKGKSFNGIEIPNIKVDLFIELDSSDNKLPLNIVSSVKDRVKKELGIDDFNFGVVSKDLEELAKKGIKINPDEFIEKLSQELIFMISNRQIIDNPDLERVRDFIDEKREDDAKNLLKVIDKESLSKFEKDEYALLEFKVSDNKKEKFDELKATFIEHGNPKKLKELYFDYIKYVEDIREEHIPSQIIKDFENIFPEDYLSDDELKILYYLKGRGFYYRGEYILAIKFLAKAKEKVGKDSRYLANILNTTTNIFTDNLFFEEAEELSDKALQIRKSLRVPETMDTISLKGNISFKATKYKQAYNFYKEVLDLKEDSRLYNYLAKTSIMLGYGNKADEYIEKSEELETAAEKKIGFLYLIKAYRYRDLNDFESMKNLYKEIILNENVFKDLDKFVIGWFCFTFAELSFKNDGKDMGMRFIYKSISYFLEDNYILEAYYVYLSCYLYGVKDVSILDIFEVPLRFETYVEKHKNLVNDYRDIFELKVSSKNRLEEFWKSTQNIDVNNLDELKTILDSVNLK